METQDTSSADRGPGNLPQRRAVRPVHVLGAGGVAAIALVGMAWVPGLQDYLSAPEAKAAKPVAAASRPARDDIRKLAAFTVDDSKQIIVEGADAQSRNDAIPLYASAVESGRGLNIGKDDPAYATALRCMTQAVYFEAAFEPLAGRRAVAQVIVNRMRHPAYPSSVCGVVYQGSQRRTGCQFSFTCDGSLLRQPAARAWQEAEQVARAALAGQIEKSVGTATHYHADYVLPKWAFELGKIDKLGRHIFYRFRGGWGRNAFFTSRYNGLERIPSMDFAHLRERLSEREAIVAVAEVVPGLTVEPDVKDRHAPADVGGRIDVTKSWRLTIPDPVQASSRYRATLDDKALGKPAPASEKERAIALADTREIAAK